MLEANEAYVIRLLRGLKEKYAGDSKCIALVLVSIQLPACLSNFFHATSNWIYNRHLKCKLSKTKLLIDYSKDRNYCPSVPPPPPFRDGFTIQLATQAKNLGVTIILPFLSPHTSTSVNSASDMYFG